ncbi:hypothetical protein [Methyloceanibacter marginalis]|nr:hypothetical protein [Methyloceanibacter marginalis]
MRLLAVGVIGHGRANLDVVAFRLIVLSLGGRHVLRTVGLRRSLGDAGGGHRRIHARRGKGGDREGQKNDENRA